MALASNAKAVSADLAKVEEARLAVGGVSRRALCRAAAVSETVFSKSIRGLRGIRPATIERLVGALERLSLERRLTRQRLDAIITLERSAT